MSTSAVIAAVEEGHIAAHTVKRDPQTKGSKEVPYECKMCHTPWPCAPIERARKVPQGHVVQEKVTQ